MLDKMREYCSIDSPSGFEKNIRELILKEISPFCECRVDRLGNIIAYKKGKLPSTVRLMVDAHLDEVGIIISAITPDGFLKFQVLGGIKPSVLLCRKVVINNSVVGVIGCKPIHLTEKEESKKLPGTDALYIDIGCSSRNEAENLVNIGDGGVLVGEFTNLGNGRIKAKAIDDRAGCCILTEILKMESDYDFYATFTFGEEIGCRGAKTAAYTVNPDAAIVLEATSAADIDGVSDENTVCFLGKGPAVSFMDRGAVYDHDYYNSAINSGILCQTKRGTTGGNNASQIHLSREGVRTLAISVPCRYIHSPSSVCDISDIENAKKLTLYMIKKICSGEI